jgi:hypothetical protein
MHGCQESKLLELHLPSTIHLNVAADDIFLLPSDNTFCCWRTPNQRRGRCGRAEKSREKEMLVG